MYRDDTKVIQIGDRKIGGGNPVLIQSMCNTKTEDVEATVAQILALEQAGCEIVRCTVPTLEAAKAITQGISKDGEIVDAAVKLGIISKSGAWFTYVNTETGRSERWQGREKVKDGLNADESLKDEIEKRVLQSLYPSKENKSANEVEIDVEE